MTEQEILSKIAQLEEEKKMLYYKPFAISISKQVNLIDAKIYELKKCLRGVKDSTKDF